MKGTGPDGLLVLQDVLRHADEWMKESGLVPQILLLDDRTPGLHFNSGALGVVGRLVVWGVVRFGLLPLLRGLVGKITLGGSRLTEHSPGND